MKLPAIPRRALLWLGGGVAVVLVLVMIVSLRGSDPAGALARAEAFEASGNHRAARVEAMNAVDHAPGDEAAWRLLARSQLALGDGTAARGTVERARNAGVPPERTRHLMAEAMLLMGEADAALAETENAEIDPEFFGEAARIRGRAFQQLGQIQAAAEAFNIAIENDPESAGLWLDIARFRLTTGEQAGAIEAVDEALRLDPADIDALILKGRMARDQYGLVASLAWFDRVLEIDDRHIPALLERAATLGEIGRMRDMLDTTRDVLALDTGNPRALYLQAVLAARARDFPLARRIVSLTGGMLDGQPSMMLLQATIDYGEQNYEAAIRRLERLLEFQPANRTATRLLGAAKFHAGDMPAVIAALGPLADRPDADSYVLTLVGRAWEREGDFERATLYLSRAARPMRSGLTPLGAPPEDAAALALIQRDAQGGGARAEVELIRAYLALGRTGDALARAETLRNANLGAPDAHLIYGDALGAVGRYGDAAAAYASAANIRFSERAALGMFEALQRAGQPEEALRVLSLFRQQNPRNIATAMISAQLNLQAGRWTQAAAILEQLRLRLGDRDAALLANLAWARYEMGDVDRALALARRAYLLLPMNASTSEIYGWILADGSSDPELGIAMLEKAQSLAPDDPQIAERLAAARAGQT
ncbi:tetratricopeptide repeat protein [Parasphingopyxis sp.]|uniref:tetratricopeptide repeat protein n=1 Tax=Parasphingopyxis sp. TaxID=1920299 RepID=UPI002601D236|nr:tetratricopeptide repeat protein [Parasphingopyxis sp.]